MEEKSSICVKKVYASFSSDEALLQKSTSGGVSSALCKAIINRGGYVAGVAYTEDFRDAEYILTNNENDLFKIQGSKYIRARLNNIYYRVKELLLEGNHVLFTGLPCNIAGLKGYLKDDYENLLTCELICDGPTKTEVHKQYVDFIENKYKSKLKYLSVRYKKYGWPTPFLQAEFENGKVLSEEFYATEYGYAFRMCKQEGCFNCKFKGNKCVGDIMIGDFWGAKDSDSFWNVNGISAVIVRSERARVFLESIDSLVLFEETLDRVISRNKRIILPAENTESRSVFAKIFDENGLLYAVKKTMPFSRRLIIKTKRILPQYVKTIVESYYNKKNIRRSFH